MGGRQTNADDRGRVRRPRFSSAAALAAVAALVLGACGDDDAATADDPADAAAVTGADDTGTSDDQDAEDEDDGDEGGTTDSSGCDRFSGDEIRAAVLEIGDIDGTSAVSSPGSGTTFTRPDGTEFAYVVDGCTFDVAVDGDDEPHEVRISLSADPEGIDLFEEFRAARDSDDTRPVDGLGDDAFVDAAFGDQTVTLLVRDGDRVVFVRSDPPFGVPLAADAALVTIAEAVLVST